MKCFKIFQKIGRIYNNRQIHIYIHKYGCILDAIILRLSNTVLLVLSSCTLPWFYYILFNLTFSVEALLAVKYSECLIIGPCFA